MRLDTDKDYFVCEYCGNIHVPNANDEGVRVLHETSDSECPVCAIPLVRAAIDGQRILYCQRCHGMLVSMDIFVPLIEDLRSRRQGTAEIVRPIDIHELDRPVRCPQCHGQMDTHLYGGGGNVILSDCERCQLNWLDHGELDRIVRSPDRQFSYGS